MGEVPLPKRGRGDGRCPARTGDLLFARREQLLPSAAVCRPIGSTSDGPHISAAVYCGLSLPKRFRKSAQRSSSCPANQPLSSAPAVAAPTAAGNTAGRRWWRASRDPPASRPSTTADARIQPCTGASRSSAASTPIPRARSRAPTTRRTRRAPPESASGPIIARPTSPGARSDRTPMAILPPAKPTARSLASIDGSYEIRAAARAARYSDAWRNGIDADEAAPASCLMRGSGARPLARHPAPCSAMRSTASGRVSAR